MFMEVIFAEMVVNRIKVPGPLHRTFLKGHICSFCCRDSPIVSSISLSKISSNISTNSSSLSNNQLKLIGVKTIVSSFENLSPQCHGFFMVMGLFYVRVCESP